MKPITEVAKQPFRGTPEQVAYVRAKVLETISPLLETARKAIVEAERRKTISEAADNIAKRYETATTETERRAAAADAWEFAFALKSAGTPAAGQWLNALGGAK